MALVISRSESPITTLGRSYSPWPIPREGRERLVSRMVELRPYAVLFDLDGTLIDSIALLLASMKHTFQGRPRKPTDEEWIEGLGTPLPKQLTPFVESDEDRERLVN